MLLRIIIIAALASLALLAGCWSGPPSADSLILKIPGCHSPYASAGGAAVRAQQEKECLIPDGTVDVATFSSSGQEQSWIIAQNAGVCETIQGTGWAALVLPTVPDYCGVAGKITHALGGRVVSS
jgi:hypothetical protein